MVAFTDAQLEQEAESLLSLRSRGVPKSDSRVLRSERILREGLVERRGKVRQFGMIVVMMGTHGRIEAVPVDQIDGSPVPGDGRPF